MKWILRVQPLRWWFLVAGCILAFLGIVGTPIVLWFIDPWPLDQQPQTPLEAYEVIVVDLAMVFGTGLAIMAVATVIVKLLWKRYKRRHPEETQVESSASD